MTWPSGERDRRNDPAINQHGVRGVKPSTIDQHDHRVPGQPGQQNHEIQGHGDHSEHGRHSRHGRHGWHGLLMIACCIPMLIIAVVLVVTGIASPSFLIVAVGCTAMMALMMAGMHGSHR